MFSGRPFHDFSKQYSPFLLGKKKKRKKNLFCFYWTRLDPARRRPTVFVFSKCSVSSSVITFSIQLFHHRSASFKMHGFFFVVDRTVKCSPLHFQMDLKAQLILKLKGASKV